MSGPAPRLRLHLSPAASRAVRSGHPWIYADRIQHQNREGGTGEIAVLYDPQDRFCALGLFDPDSPIRVRVLHRGAPVNLTPQWWHDRLEQALRPRESMFAADTNAWRWIHGENDGWPGLVLDRYADVAVLKLYSAAWLPRLGDVARLLTDRLHPRSLILRLSRNIAVAAEAAGRADGDLLAGEPVPAPVTFLEHGIRFEADVIRGQKTGFFLDQRDNRALVASLARDADVLNAFSFSGGFSLHAAAGGARSVTDLDISPHALASARRNWDLNPALGPSGGVRHRTVQADAFDWLGTPRPPAFDLIILDPPSMARRESERTGALRAYARLAELAARHLRPRGRLVAASCSAHVPAPEFFSAVLEGVRRAGRRMTQERTTAHPADHPATFPEAHYLKAIYLADLPA